MSAQTRNDSRYERQAHAHVFSSRPHHERKASHLISCGEIVPVWGSSPPKQELFHRNFGATRQSGGAGHAPESVSQLGASEWDAGFRYSHQPETATRFEPLFRDALSAEGLKRKLQPTIRSKSGLQFPRARQRAADASPRLLPQQGLLGRDRQRTNLVAGGVCDGRGDGGERRVDDDLADRLGAKRAVGS